MQRLRALLKDADQSRGDWIIGKKPIHYKRLSVSTDEADRLAKIGAAEIGAAFGTVLYYSQAVIAGAILSGDYDTAVIVSCSQYGKSFLLGRICLLLADRGRPVSVAGATKDTTEIILGHIRRAASDADETIKRALLGETKRKIDKLDQSLSKTRIGFSTGGYVEALTLGDTFSDLTKNHAVGRGTDYIVDEAALVSDQALRELGRRELSTVDGEKRLLVMISNPHRPGTFYDKLTGPADSKTLILWMDALTAAQEQRWTPEQILNSEFAQDDDTRQRYWMCELPTAGHSMFGEIKVEDVKPDRRAVHFVGVDAAYKGKDNICVCDAFRTGYGLHINSVYVIKKPKWIDGVTSEEITREVAKLIKNVKARRVCVDQGYGVWLIEGLIKKGVPAVGVNFGGGPTKERVARRHYAAAQAANMRAEMHLDLQSLIESNSVTFSKQAYNAVKSVLPFITKTMKSTGKYFIRPKDEIKALVGKSPDELDSVLLAIHAAFVEAGSHSVYMT